MDALIFWRSTRGDKLEAAPSRVAGGRAESSLPEIGATAPNAAALADRTTQRRAPCQNELFYETAMSGAFSGNGTKPSVGRSKNAGNN